MTPQRRTALVSVFAAALLVAIKLAAGVASGSLGLISEAIHSGTDLVAALLTFFAVGVAGRPADRGHPYGHGKADHVAALGEAAVLALASLVIAGEAFSRLLGASEPDVHASAYTFAVVGVVLAVDAGRTLVSFRAGRRYRSAALVANALHFASDFAGTLAVLVGLLLVQAGHPNGDSAAALFVAALVLVAAGRIARVNVDVLMDRAPAGAEDAARRAIAALDPPVELRRLRLRQAGGRHFADVVIGVSPGEAVAQGHAAADAVEEALERALPESDVVVHVEPAAEQAVLRERAQAAALTVPRVREVHNVSVLELEGGVEISLHLKLPGDLSLNEAHQAATAVERAIEKAVPAARAVHTHIEPLHEAAAGRAATAGPAEAVASVVAEATGAAPREVRFLETGRGLVVYVTVGLDPATPLAEAHARASAVEERIRTALPTIADVVVHTEP
ncbi:MAG: cation diffusion facilitator family transporter [Gaiellaceae bacterium]